MAFDFPKIPGLTPRPEPFAEGLWPCLLHWHTKNHGLPEKLSMLASNLRTSDSGFCILGFHHQGFERFVSYPNAADMVTLTRIVIASEHHLMLLDTVTEHLWPCLFEMDNQTQNNVWEWIRNTSKQAPQTVANLVDLPLPKNSTPTWILPTFAWSTPLIEACSAFEELTQHEWKTKEDSWLQFVLPRLTADDTITKGHINVVDGKIETLHPALSIKFNTYLARLLQAKKLTPLDAGGVAWDHNNRPEPLLFETHLHRRHLHQTRHFFLKTLANHKPYLPV
jgi:hypothetical protein